MKTIARYLVMIGAATVILSVIRAAVRSNPESHRRMIDEMQVGILSEIKRFTNRHGEYFSDEDDEVKTNSEN